MRVKARWVAALMMAALSVFALSPKAASAHTGGPPTGEPLICSPTQAWSTDGYVRVCFEREGDDFWVYDARADGASAVVSWSTSDGEAADCRNSHGSGTWHECSYDLTEGETVYWAHWTYDGDTGTWSYKSGGYYTAI